MAETKHAALRAKISAGAAIIAPGVYDGLSARIADAHGFDALYLSGFGVSASQLAKPDNGFLTAEDMYRRIASLIAAIETPLIADADTGFGNIAETVALYETAGAAGIQLEDQRVPKICGHIAGREVIQRDVAVANIEQAVAARQDKDFLIVARTDAREQEGLDEAIARGQAFHAAGADIIFVESPEGADEMAEIGRALGHTTLLANMVEGGRTPLLPRDELISMGFNFIIYPVAPLAAAAAALNAAYDALKTGDGETDRVSFNRLKKMVGFTADK